MNLKFSSFNEKPSFLRAVPPLLGCMFALCWIGAAPAASFVVDILVPLPVPKTTAGVCPKQGAGATALGLVADGYNSAVVGNSAEGVILSPGVAPQTISPGSTILSPDGVHTGIPVGGFTFLHAFNLIKSSEAYAQARDVLALSATIFYMTYSNNPPLPPYDCWYNYTIEVDNLVSPGSGFSIGSSQNWVIPEIDPSATPMPCPTGGAATTCPVPCVTSGSKTTCTITVLETLPWSASTKKDVHDHQALLYTQADEVLALSERLFQNAQFNANQTAYH